MQILQTIRQEWDDLVISGPAGPVAVTLNARYRLLTGGLSAGNSTLTFQTQQGPLPELPDTGGVWTPISIPLNYTANVPSLLSLTHKLDIFTVLHYTAPFGDYAFSLADIVFTLPPGYTADIPSAGVVENVFVGNSPPVPPVPALSVTGISILAAGLIAATLFARRRRSSVIHK